MQTDILPLSRINLDVFFNDGFEVLLRSVVRHTQSDLNLFAFLELQSQTTKIFKVMVRHTGSILEKCWDSFLKKLLRFLDLHHY